MYQFNHASELLQMCENHKLDISEVLILAEMEESGRARDAIRGLMEKQYQIMKESISKGLSPDVKSVGGLIGGNAHKLSVYGQEKGFCGKTVLKAVSYALAVTEINAAMGKIVAAPTAGASGIVPGVIVALQEDQNYSDVKAVEALFVAAAIGRIIAINATLSGAEGGCQAECGSASAMAAAAAVNMAGGSPEMCMDAAAVALKGLLGLVCDPVAGLVEVPCSKRNATSAANALICADMALAGIKSFIPFDEVVDAMYRVGRKMSPDLRETAQGGCAITPTALQYAKRILE